MSGSTPPIGPISMRVNSSSIFACTNSLILLKRAGPPPSQRPGGTSLACIRIEQCGGNRLLDEIQEQSATRKARNAFRIYRLDQCSQPCVNHLAPVAEFDRTTHTLAGGPQGSIGNAKEQTLLVTGSNPSFHTTREKSHFPRLERYTPHCGTLQAHLNEAGPQHHRENMLIPIARTALRQAQAHPPLLLFLCGPCGFPFRMFIWKRYGRSILSARGESCAWHRRA